MINTILTKIKDKLNDYFREITALDASQVSFPDGAKMEPLILPNNSVVPMLVHIEEEKMFRQANLHDGILTNGSKTGLRPSIGITVQVLFICNFSDYEQSLQFLSLVIAYFHKYPLLDHYNTPSMPDSVEKVIIEMVTMPIAQRNELWSSLRTTYRPSVLYKMGVLIYHDDSSTEIGREIVDIEIKTKLQ